MNKSQSSKSELDKTVDGILRIMSIKLTTGAIMTGKVPDDLYAIEAEAQSKLLDLALSCLPDKTIEDDRFADYVKGLIRGQNETIDTIEANMKRKFS